MGDWKNTPVAVGGNNYGDNHVEHFGNGIWKIKSDFPFVSKFNYIYSYSMATVNGELYIFGKITFKRPKI